MDLKQCGFCGKEKEIVARGFCRACYQRWLKRGTTEYAIRNRKPCQIDGCSELSEAHNLCAKHLKRWQRYGHTEPTRPRGWGSARKHPLYETWRWKSRTEQLSEEWKEFWQFVEDVGDKPEDKPILRRLRKDEPLSKTNFYWAEPILKVKNGEDFRETRRQYAKEWRKKNPAKVKSSDIKKRFGITIDEYEEIFEKQNGVCAICKRPESHYKFLAVDHSHDTGKVRGLLCSKCNPALGGFEDSIEFLESAILYLKTIKQ